METPDSESANSVESSDIEQKLNQLQQQIEYEERQWHTAQLHPGMINIDVYMLRLQLSMAFDLLKELTGKSEDEMNLIFKQTILKQLQADRTMINQARAASLVVAKTQLFGPDGNPITNGS